MYRCYTSLKPHYKFHCSVGEPESGSYVEFLQVQYDGLVLWMPPIKYDSSCKVDMTYFPFDTQTCYLRFGSWVHNIYKLNLDFSHGKKEMMMDEYVDNSEWDIVENVAEKVTKFYPCCSAPYSDIRFTLKLQRKVTFTMRLILIPSIILSVMSLLIFWIPPQRPDRTSSGKCF